MELDLNSRNVKWNREQSLRREKAKRKIEMERRERGIAAKAREELEKMQKQKRVERVAELERQEQQEMEELRLTGGIKYLQQLRPVPTNGDGDKITLPVSALKELNPQNALELGVFTFELSFEDQTADESGDISSRIQTHAGVLEFVADEGTAGLSPKVAASLFKQTKELPGSVQVRFVRLEKGKFVTLQPRGNGFGNFQMDFKQILERSLKTHTTLTEGDILFIRHGKETFEVLVLELKPEKAVHIFDTDLEVDIVPCEAVTKAKKDNERLKQEAARVVALAQEKEQWKANKMASLMTEPSGEECQMVKVVLRMPEGQATRHFLHSSLVRHVFDFVEALTGENAQHFQLAATYPRRLFKVEAADKTLQDVGLNSRQAVLFVERLVANEVSTDLTTPNQISRKDEATNERPHKDEAFVDRPRTVLPAIWDEARKSLEERLDESMHATSVPAIHAMEPVIPITSSADQEIKWQAQLSELEQTGFMNRSLNIEVLERYQGRLLRVVNFLSEMM